ncbi:low molecular weight protein-tyrosine-phosphatase [Haloechinothrix sp. LS1_15]|uniref:low molecular weight protein-tyrosine-phosphatase n=1 Tax=Haloechinothrix sp. LS1_15 TaxID=2652248 RepID=UPI0029477A93|nr:low molecular weight protein-tyrosine-phosphatase [Haloechinothrix sp. LS1_15]MDV6013827.1 low molecular weight phosphotyrosine protein phosphatase [Haloechinothrix sp. LS1_15]
MHVSFVCSGNICRSPMAANVFREHLRRAGLDGQVRVTSAGTGPWHIGEPADERAAATLRKHGYPDEHVAAQVNPEHLEADLLLAADAGHLRVLRRHVEPDRVVLLRSFDPAAPEGAEVPDPYYSGGFDTVLEMIEGSMPGLIEWVRERL